MLIGKLHLSLAEINRNKRKLLRLIRNNLLRECSVPQQVRRHFLDRQKLHSR